MLCRELVRQRFEPTGPPLNDKLDRHPGQVLVLNFDRKLKPNSDGSVTFVRL